MRQTHTPGERLFINYAGQTVGVTTTREIPEDQVFVTVLEVPNYTYLEGHMEPATAGLDRQSHARSSYLAAMVTT